MSKYAGWKSFEHQIVNMFRKAGWKQAKRNWSEQFGKKSGIDILNTEPYAVQCKYQKSPNLIKAWQEASNEAKTGELPVGICRNTKKKKTFIIMELKDWKWMLNLIK